MLFDLRRTHGHPTSGPFANHFHHDEFQVYPNEVHLFLCHAGTLPNPRHDLQVTHETTAGDPSASALILAICIQIQVHDLAVFSQTVQESLHDVRGLVSRWLAVPGMSKSSPVYWGGLWKAKGELQLLSSMHPNPKLACCCAIMSLVFCSAWLFLLEPTLELRLYGCAWAIPCVCAVLCIMGGWKATAEFLSSNHRSKPLQSLLLLHGRYNTYK